ncbi:MAG: transporter permease [Herbaspirillum sp.]|nr:transporter permease [Herbaspirillum sp.]
MSTYLIRRILYSGISLAGLIILVFFLARLTGNPADVYLPADTPQDVRQEFSQSHGFNDPALVQFERYVVDLAHLDLGESLRQQRPALSIVMEAFPTTLMLSALAMTLVMIVSIAAGSLAARRPNGVFDRVVSLIALTSASVPNFWLAIVSVLIFSVGLRWLPTSGTGGVSHWVLPLLVLTVRPCGIIAQVVRSSMIDALSSAYVKTARAKGVRKSAIIFVHALRNAMLPVMTVAGDQAAGMINGVVIVEIIFGFPGIGKLMMDSIANREFVIVQAAVIVVALAIFLMNFLIDLTYVMLDPRIRYS